MNMYTNQRAARQYGDRVLRESSVLMTADDVWSDVASNLELGFRSGQGGPYVYGDLQSGATVEIEVRETVEGEYRTVAKASSNAEGKVENELLVRPHDAFTRMLQKVLRAPAELDPGFRQLFFVRANRNGSAHASATLSDAVRETILRLAHRRPELYADSKGATLVLEGVELVHEHLTDIVAMLTELTRTTTSNAPYRT